MERWCHLEPVEAVSPDQAQVGAVVHKDSPWFSGHFPGMPILPGIAMLSLVAEAIRDMEVRNGKTMRISGVRRVRFRQQIGPEDPISIVVSLKGEETEGAYSFRISVVEQIACTGIMTAKRID